MAIFTHVAIGTNDIAKARAFYDSVLGPLGYKRVSDFGDGGSAWGETAPEFFVLKPANGQPATYANGGTVSFVAARMKGRSARAPGIPMPTAPMPAISTATSSPSIA